MNEFSFSFYRLFFLSFLLSFLLSLFIITPITFRRMISRPLFFPYFSGLNWIEPSLPTLLPTPTPTRKRKRKIRNAETVSPDQPTKQTQTTASRFPFVTFHFTRLSFVFFLTHSYNLLFILQCHHVHTYSALHISLDLL